MKKVYFTQTEIAKILQEELHTIRYWEKQFPLLKPRNKAGKSIYNEKKLELFHLVKKFTRDEKLSNAGVKQKIEEFLMNEKNIFDENISHENILNKSSENAESVICFTKAEFIELLQLLQITLQIIKNHKK
jgi:DNA-binding transcriptional MerR regulator